MSRHCEEIKLWSVTEVEEFLKTKGFDENVTGILKGNEIDGKSLLLLNNADVASMGFKMGPAAKLRKLLETLREDESVNRHVVNKDNETGSIGGSKNLEEPSTSACTSYEQVTEKVQEVNVIEILKPIETGSVIVAKYTARNEHYITHEEWIQIVNIVCMRMMEVNLLKHFPSTETKHFPFFPEDARSSYLNKEKL